MYYLQCVLIVLCFAVGHIAATAIDSEGVAAMVENSADAEKDGDANDDTAFDDMYGALDTQLTRLTDYAQDKVRRKTTAALNNLIEKNANALMRNLNTIQSTRSLQELAQQKHDHRHGAVAAVAPKLDSLRMGKVLNALAPYYGHHEKHFVGEDDDDDDDDSFEASKVGDESNGCESDANEGKDISCNENRRNGQRKTVARAAADVNMIEKKVNWVKRNPGQFKKFSSSHSQSSHKDDKVHDDIGELSRILAHSCELCPPDNSADSLCCSLQKPAKHKRQTLENLADKSQQQLHESKSFISAVNTPPKYPDVVAKSSPNLRGYQLQIPSSDENQIKTPLPNRQPISSDAYSDFLNNYDQQQSRIQLARRDYNSSSVAQTQPNSFNNVTSSSEVTADCAQYLDTNNASAVLERVLEELELIRAEKNGSLRPEGTPCDILGSWNSEIIGLRFDINDTTTTNASASNNSHEPSAAAAAAHDLSITLFDHSPPRRNTLMDRNWTCSGYTLHNKGGPFYISAAEKKEKLLATFTGICKTCGGVDTIFGTWSIVHPAKDCHDLQMSIETKRDIFRKEMLYVKKMQKLEQLKNTNSSVGETKQEQQQRETASDQIPSSTTDYSSTPSISPIPGRRLARRYH